jgi:hypothetical protein
MPSFSVFAPKRMYGLAASRPAATAVPLGTIYRASDGGQHSICVLNGGSRVWTNIAVLTSIVRAIVRFDVAANVPSNGQSGVGRRLMFAATDSGAVTRFT